MQGIRLLLCILSWQGPLPSVPSTIQILPSQHQMIKVGPPCSPPFYSSCHLPGAKRPTLNLCIHTATTITSFWTSPFLFCSSLLAWNLPPKKKLASLVPPYPQLIICSQKSTRLLPCWSAGDSPPSHKNHRLANIQGKFSPESPTNVFKHLITPFRERNTKTFQSCWLERFCDTVSSNPKI